MGGLVSASLNSIAALIAARKLSPVEVVKAHLEQIEKVNSSVNAVVTLAPDALDRARNAEAELAIGERELI